MSSRERILTDLRAALTTPVSAHPAPPVPRGSAEPASPWPSAAAQFRERFESLGGHWHEAGTSSAAAGLVAGLVRGSGATAALLTRDERGLLDRLDLESALSQTDCRALRQLESRDQSELVGVMITGAECAIAETGSLGLLVSAGQGRLASLLAPVHIAVLEADQFVATLGEFLERVGPRLGSGERSAALLISGPSRSGDIEMTLSVGVHGPGEIHVVVVPETERR